MLIQGKILSYGNDLSDVFNIREQVFVKEFGANKDQEFDDLDQEAMHVIVYEEDPNWKGNQNNNAVATGRILFDGTSCYIEKVAVLKEFRGKLYGDFTVRMLLNRAFIAGINQVSIISKESTAGFFEKIGFHKDSELDNNGVKYYNMSIQSGDVITQCKKCEEKAFTLGKNSKMNSIGNSF